MIYTEQTPRALYLPQSPPTVQQGSPRQMEAGVYTFVFQVPNWPKAFFEASSLALTDSSRHFGR